MTDTSVIAKGLLDSKAVKISIDPPFTWVSGIKSPIYCDNRILISIPEVRDLIVDEMCALVSFKKADYVAGTATAAIPWAAFIAQKLKLPMVYVRPEPKAHGAGKQIEGFLEPGKKVILIEDLISTGGSSIKAAQVLVKEAKAVLKDVIAIVSYEMAASKKAFAEAGVTLTTLTTFTILLEEVKKQGYLSQDEVATILEFSKDPPNWWSNMKTNNFNQQYIT